MGRHLSHHQAVSLHLKGNWGPYTGHTIEFLDKVGAKWARETLVRDGPTNCDAKSGRMSDNLGASTTTALDSKEVSSIRNDVVSNETVYTNSGIWDQHSTDLIESTSKQYRDSSENTGSDPIFLSASGTKDFQGG
ncbi:hypothetical protein VNO77_18455 [Canavalia gladiata]|uniref:Uncharacterized protein n=1 Tax=Canavalia gladiata TaxID=3824 RepID=A0AAN9LPP9_CANGL